MWYADHDRRVAGQEDGLHAGPGGRVELGPGLGRAHRSQPRLSNRLLRVRCLVLCRVRGGGSAGLPDPIWGDQEEEGVGEAEAEQGQGGGQPPLHGGSCSHVAAARVAGARDGLTDLALSPRALTRAVAPP